jgi:transposase
MSTENYRLRNGKVIDSNGLEQLELEGLSEDAIADRYDISKSYLLRLRKR